MNDLSSIQPAQFPQDVDAVRALFREYAAGLGFDLCFQGFDEELAMLPGKYATPLGGVFLAARRGEPVGCVAFRPLEKFDCEMKRLFVRPLARDAGYRRICLDTIETMREARTLYQSLGFHEIAPYVFNPIAGAKYMAREL